jgi:hypothetical protein
VLLELCPALAMPIDQPLDEETFKRLVAQTRLHGRGREMARAVLVQGKRPAEVGPEFGVTRQAAVNVTARVLRELRAEGVVTKNWITATVVCSPELAEFVRYLAVYEQARAGVREEPKIPDLSKEVIETIAEVLRQWAKN